MAGDVRVDEVESVLRRPREHRHLDVLEGVPLAMDHPQTRNEANRVGEGLDAIVRNVQALQRDEVADRIRDVRDVVAADVQRQQGWKTEQLLRKRPSMQTNRSPYTKQLLWKSSTSNFVRRAILGVIDAILGITTTANGHLFSEQRSTRRFER